MRVFSPSGRSVAALAFLTLAPLIAHALYSSLGFNPAHEGVVLSAARRLLDGQMPHRDFVYLRPALSPLLHLPIVWLGGERMVWITRLCNWFQLAVMAWVWVAIINRQLKASLNVLSTLALAVIALIFSASTFLTLTWHVLKGLRSKRW